MGKKYNFKYIVIGSGPAGSAAALTLATKSKKSVALIESRFFGGSNLNTHDVPHAVAFDFAHHYFKAQSYPELKNQDFSFNFPTIAARELSVVLEAGGNNKKLFEEAGVVCISGFANFLDRHTIAVNQKKLTAETFILATGSKLKTTEIAGTNTVDFLTPSTAVKVQRLPKVVTVVGGGSTGCELAEYFAELGSQVLILERSERLLPREDKEAGEAISEYLIRKFGVSVLTNCQVISIEQDEFSKYLIFRYDNTEKMVRTESIVLATGSTPFLDYGLENTNIKFKKNGIAVDKFFQTSAKNIYAIGDCISDESSTDRAYLEGTTLASNLLNGTKTLVNYKGLIRLTNTYPEVATVGLSEDDLTRHGRKYKKAIIKLEETTASKTNNFNYGFVKLISDKTYHIIGAVIVAPHAGLLASEIAIAIRHNLTALEIASTPHIMNSYNYAIKLAAKKLIDKTKPKK